MRAPPPRGVCLPAIGMCHCLRCFPARKVPAPLGGSTSGPGPASPPARARRPPSYKETSRCRRPSRGAPRLSSRPGSRRSLPAPSAATEVSGGGGAPRVPVRPPGSPSAPPGRSSAPSFPPGQSVPAAGPDGPGREAGVGGCGHLGFPPSGILLMLQALERAVWPFFFRKTIFFP